VGGEEKEQKKKKKKKKKQKAKRNGLKVNCQKMFIIRL